MIRKAKQQYNDKINKILQKSSFNDKLSWRLIKINKKSSPNNIPPLEHQNKTITDPVEKAEILHSVLGHPDPPNLDPKHKTFHNFIEHKTIQISIDIPITDPLDILNSPIQKYELINCIHELDEDKAYGSDLIHNQMIMNGGPPLWCNLLTSSINA